MAITPDTNIKLLKVPLELSNKNQLTFSSKEEQYNYFNSLPKIEIDECNYQRKDNIINFPAHIDSIIEYNYVMYQNKNYTNKWFYAFVIGMEYENNGNTKIKIATDVFQTWQFDIIWKQTFIEREHLAKADDVPGANLYPESLETGELKISATATIEDLEPAYIVAYSGNQLAGSDPVQQIDQNGHRYNGIFSSITYILANDYGFDVLMRTLQNGNNSDYIVTVFTIPSLAVKSLLPVDPPGQHTYFYKVLDKQLEYSQNPIIKTLNSRPSSIDGYTPRNKKLLTYPYLYLGFNPQNGSSKIYRYEDFTNATPSFKLISEINPSPEIQVIPQNYRGDSGDSLNDNGTIGGYPTISHKTDVFNTWLAQNSEIINLQMQQEQFNYDVESGKNLSNTIGGIISNTMTGNIGGAFSDLLGGSINQLQMTGNHDFYIKNQMAQIEKQKLMPDKVNMSSSNATLLGYDLFKKNVFTRYNIKRQFAEKIDKYFDMYGYATNNVKIPNLNNRSNWNYVKTIGCNIIGSVPQLDLQNIKSIFDNGVTLWHNPNTFLDYSQANN